MGSRRALRRRRVVRRDNDEPVRQGTRDQRQGSIFWIMLRTLWRDKFYLMGLYCFGVVILIILGELLYSKKKRYDY